MANILDMANILLAAWVRTHRLLLAKIGYLPSFNGAMSFVPAFLDDMMISALLMRI
jgi:hypothetical protein